MKIVKEIVIALISALFILWISGCHNGDSFENRNTKLNIYLQAWNTGEVELLDGVAHPQFELRMSPLFKPQIGLDSLKHSILSFRTAYPDFNIIADEIIFSEQAITARWTITATHSGPGILPPSGKKVNVPGMSIIHFEEGKIKDEWIFGNDLLWLQQLGFKLIPPEISQ